MTAAPRVLAKIGAGGMATVFVARDAEGALVAVKRPHAHLFDDPSFAAQLGREAAIASRLRAKTLVAVRGLVDGERGLELVMEYVDGLPLAALVRAWSVDATPVSIGAVLTLAIDLCDALATVHEARGDDGEPLGLVHRDVSPENIIVGSDGTAKLIDFGLARSIARGDRSTTGGVLKGKAGYLAPEYIRGAPIDRRVDVFALGIVVWEAIARKRLFLGENEADTLQRVLAAKVPRLEIGGAVGEGLDAILRDALARSPADRCMDVRELRARFVALARDRALTIGAGVVVDAFGPAATREIEARRALTRSSGEAPSAATASPARPAASWRAAKVAALFVAFFAVAASAYRVVHSRATATAMTATMAPPTTTTTTTITTTTSAPAPSATTTSPSPSSSASVLPSSSSRAIPSAKPAPTHRPRPNPY